MSEHEKAVREAIDAFCREHGANLVWQCGQFNQGIHDAFVMMLARMLARMLASVKPPDLQPCAVGR